MNEDEIQRLVVRLTGDGSSFQGMLTSAQTASSKAAEVVEAASRRIEQMGQSLQGFTQNAVSALGSFGISHFLRDTFQQFEGHETNAIRLTAALRANGREVDSTLTEYHEFARSIASVSTASEEQILSSLRAAETHELTGAAAERAAQAALNLSYATHGSADGMEHMMRVTAAMEKGDIKTAQRYGRMIEQLRGVRDEGEFVRKYQLLLATGMQTATDVANSSAGQIAKLGHAYSEFKMELGAIVADVVKPYVKSLIELVEWLKNLDRGTKTIIVAVLGLVAAALALGPALAALKFWAALSFNPLVLGIVATGAAIGVWVNEVGGVTNAWTIARGAVADFIVQNEALVASIGAVVGAVGLAVLVYKVLVFVIGVTSSVLTALGVFKAIDVATWLIWNAAILVAKGVLWLLNAALVFTSLQFTAWNFLLGSGVIFSVLWSAAVVGAKVVAWLLVAALTAVNFLWAAYSAGGLAGLVSSVAFSAGAAVAKIATWLLNAALTVTNLLLGAIPLIIGAVVVALVGLAAGILAVAGTLAVVTAAVAVVTVGFGMLVTIGAGVYRVFDDVAQTFRGLPSTFGPMRLVTEVFGEWYTILKDVVRAAKVDMPLAWAILRSAAQLAVSQLRDQWAPLWDYIQRGFEAAWRVVSISMRLRFIETIDLLKAAVMSLPTVVGDAFKDVFDMMFLRATQFTARLIHDQHVVDSTTAAIGILERRSAAASETRESEVARLQRELAAAQVSLDASLRNFTAGADSSETIRLREEINRLRGLIPEAERRARDAALGTGNAIDATKKSLDNFKGVLTGSSEALSRISSYRERLAAPLASAAASEPQRGNWFDRSGPAAQPTGGAAGAAPTPAGPPRPDAAAPEAVNPLSVLLTAIRDVLRERLPTDPLTSSSLFALGGFPS